MSTLDAVFGIVLSASWRVGCLVAVFLGVRLVLRRRVSAHAIFGAWLVLMLGLLLPVAVPTAWSPFNLARPLRGALEQGAGGMGQGAVPSGGGAAAPAVPVDLGAASDGAVGSVGVVIAADKASLASLASSSPERWLAGLWLGGCVFFLLRRIAAEWRFARRLGRGLRPVDARVVASARRAAERLGLSRLPAMGSTDLVQSPALQGIFRPRLLIPARVAVRLSDEELDLVVLHELGHLQRRDILSCAVIDLGAAIHWFNPLAWLGRRLARIDCEHACDEFVLGRMPPERQADYGLTLLKVVALVGGSERHPATLGIFENNAQLKQRIRMIAAYTSPRWLRTAAGGLLLSLLVLAGTTREISGQPVSSASPVVLQLVQPGDERGEQLTAAIGLVRNRLAAFGVSAPDIRAVGPDRMEIRLPADAGKAREMLDQVFAPGRLELRAVHPKLSPGPGTVSSAPPGYQVLDLISKAPDGSTLRESLYVRNSPGLTGDAIASSGVQLDAMGRPEVRVEFTPAGRQRFHQFTGEVAADARAAGGIGRIAIIVDGRMSSAPTIRDAIDSASIQITGPSALPDAIEMSNRLADPLRKLLIRVSSPQATQPPPVPLTVSNAVPAPPPAILTLHVLANGEVRWNGAPISRADLPVRLARWRQELGEGARLELVGDVAAPYSAVVTVLDFVRAAGIGLVSIATPTGPVGVTSTPARGNVAELEAAVASRRAAVADLRTRLRDQHPEMVAAVTALETAERELAQATGAGPTPVPNRSATVAGQVQRPGEVSFGTEASILITSAITRAGGFTRLGRGNGVSVVRKQPDGTFTTFGPFDVQGMLEGRNLQNGIFEVLPGDIVTVPERIF